MYAMNPLLNIHDYLDMTLIFFLIEADDLTLD